MDDATLGGRPDSSPTRGVLRMTSADARQTLEHLQSSPMLSEGKLCLIGLDAVRGGMADRWRSRREVVHQHLERVLQRQVGAHGFYLRISETDYLVAQPNVSRLAGQAFCLNALREVLHYFLGEALPVNIMVHEVTEVGDRGVTARKLDVAQVEEAEIAERASLAVADGVKAMSQDRWTPFVAGDGRRLRASCHLEPVFALKTFSRIGYRMARRVLQMPGDVPLSPAEVNRLTRADIERIDFATLSRGLNRLQEDGAGATQPSLILPVSYVTLSNHRGRALLADFFRAAQKSVQQGLICEVCDIEGVPPGALLTALSMIRPLCLFVIARLSGVPPKPLEALKDIGLQGVSVERPAGLSAGDFAAFVKAALTAARPVTRTVMVYHLAHSREAAIAGLLGATHGGLAPAERAVRYGDDANASAA
ncbi:MAG: hypothetical protein JO127_05585 [Caulobacteraceae bacterium]|nr:hypothetical protein [Caulobacteraceae bacterium]